jgi:hypothetical protein
MKINNKDPFWFENFNILFRKDRLNEFFPNELMTTNEQLNSLTRLSFYISIILFIYNKNPQYFYISLIGLIATYSINKNTDKILDMDIKEVFNIPVKPSKLVIPTKDNPFMNILMDDYKNPERKITKNMVENKEVKEEINNKFEYNLYKDISDVYGKNNSQRQYYTNPITTIPNDQKNFAKWLYGKPKTCKEGNPIQCTKNIYTPLNSGTRLPMV